MLFQTLALALATVPAEKPVELPKGPAPQVVVATYGDAGAGRDPFLDIVAIVFVPDEREEAVPVGTGQAKRMQPVLKPVRMTTRYPLTDRVIAIYGRDGRRVALKDVPKLLPGPSPVLASADGKEVDPFYLRLAREGTLVIVSPQLTHPRVMMVGRNPPVLLK